MSQSSDDELLLLLFSVLVELKWDLFVEQGVFCTSYLLFLTLASLFSLHCSTVAFQVNLSQVCGTAAASSPFRSATGLAKES